MQAEWLTVALGAGEAWSVTLGDFHGINTPTPKVQCDIAQRSGQPGPHASWLSMHAADYECPHLQLGMVVPHTWNPSTLGG